MFQRDVEWPRNFLTCEEATDSDNFEEIENLIRVLTSKAEKSQATLDEINVELKQAQNRIFHLEEENKNLKENIRKLQSKDRENNIIVFGLPPTTNKEENLIFLERALEVEIHKKDLNNIYDIGKKEVENRPVKIEFLSHLKKSEILKNAYKLKDKGLKSIYITHDLTKEDQKINKYLRHFLNDAKKLGKTATIKYNKLLVDGTTYTYEHLLRHKHNPFVNQDAAVEENDIISDTVEDFEETNKRKNSSDGDQSNRKFQLEKPRTTRSNSKK
ncbi:unnamed protein product [Phaedon cochleariae]|uniref:Uncharacterized protein n=1 Tax=Phaedon cochleariae TaxID=80249 RepID=A0A9N9SH36_PHACE|nr:unnamed protein product [Phaedon cochleariae]